LRSSHKRADVAFSEGNRRVLRSALEVYGVRAPELGAIARAWLDAHPCIPCADRLELAEVLWHGRSQEERMLALLLLMQQRRRLLGLQWQHCDRWRRDLDNWGLCDLLATKVFGPWLAAEPATRLAHLGELDVDADVWSRRLALVATVPPNRPPSRCAQPGLTLALVDCVKAERVPMVN
jgi:hypothetical protein